MGVIFAAVAALMTLSASITTSVPSAAIIELLIALECLVLGVRLMLTSSILLSPDSVIFRTRRLRKVVVPIHDVASVSEGTRRLLFSRVFPRITLKSGEQLNLTSFELRNSFDRNEMNSVAEIVSHVVDEVRLSASRT
jgi:hypothetical protein